MARQGISKEQVYEAATALQEAGAAPTVQNVREHIGSGSYSTISSYLAAWKTEHAGQVPANIPDIPEKVTRAFHQVWATAVLAAQEDIETQRQALEAMRREIEQDRADMAAEIKRLETELEETAGKLEDVGRALDEERKKKAAAEKAVMDLRVENTRLDERATAAENRAGELKEQVESLQERLAAAAGQKEKKRKPGEPRPKE